MVDAEEMEDGGVVVVDVAGLVHDADAELVRLAVGQAPFHAAADQERGEGSGEVAAAERRSEKIVVNRRAVVEVERKAAKAQLMTTLTVAP